MILTSYQFISSIISSQNIVFCFLHFWPLLSQKSIRAWERFVSTMGQIVRSVWVNYEYAWKNKAPTDSEEQQKSFRMAVDTTLQHCDGSVEICSYPPDVQALLLTYSDASKRSRGDILNRSENNSLASLANYLWNSGYHWHAQNYSDSQLPCTDLQFPDRGHRVRSRSFKPYSKNAQTIMWCTLYFEFIAVAVLVSLRL